jgi:hypothetical protein
VTKLANVEEIHFYPKEGSFDVEAAAAAIASIGFSYRDPHVPQMFLIFDNAESRERCREVREDDPYASLPHVLLIRVEPDEVYINQFAGERFDEYARAFVTWLLATYSCRVFNDFGKQITDLTVDSTDVPQP